MEFLILLVIIIFIIGSLSAGSKKNNYKRYIKNSSYEKNQLYRDEQLLVSAQAFQYSKRKLLNSHEKSIYWTLVKLLKNDYCINPQASLGEVITCENADGHKAINSKRSDFLITDKQFNPVAVIEYYGEGHYQGNYEIRDETKETALTKASIKYIVVTDTDDQHIRDSLMEAGLIKIVIN